MQSIEQAAGDVDRILGIEPFDANAFVEGNSYASRGLCSRWACGHAPAAFMRRSGTSHVALCLACKGELVRREIQGRKPSSVLGDERAKRQVRAWRLRFMFEDEHDVHERFGILGRIEDERGEVVDVVLTTVDGGHVFPK